MDKKEIIGKAGEAAVRTFLVKHGYDVIASNIMVFQGKQIGEIDILATKNRVLYIVEVKSASKTASEAWSKGDVLRPSKHAKLYKLRTILAVLGKQASQIGDLETVRFLLGSAHGLDVELEKGLISGFSSVRVVLARVVMTGVKKCDIEFSPIDSGYY